MILRFWLHSVLRNIPGIFPFFHVSWRLETDRYIGPPMLPIDIWPFEYRPIYDISTDILVCLSTAQFEPTEFYWNLFNQFFHVLLILFANNFHLLFCTFCLVKLVYLSSYAAVSRGCKQSTPILTKIKKKNFFKYRYRFQKKWYRPVSSAVSKIKARGSLFKRTYFL